MFELTIRTENPKTLRGELGALLEMLTVDGAAQAHSPAAPIAAVPVSKATEQPARPTTVPVAPAAAAPNQPSVPVSSAPIQPPVAPPVVPVAAAPEYTRDQIMTAGAALIDTGKINELMGLLNIFGVQAVKQLRDDQLGAFATELRKLGAQI